MKRYLPIVTGLIALAVVNLLIFTLVDGTDSGSIIIRNMVSLVIAVAVIITTLMLFLGGN